MTGSMTSADSPLPFRGYDLPARYGDDERGCPDSQLMQAPLIQPGTP
jgi:hypothetical protein